jgi:hypothetical protein
MKKLKKIIVEERKKINFYDYYKNKSGEITKIFLDELKSNKIKQRTKLSSENNNYYKQLVDYGDNELFTNLLDKNIYEIINILYFQDQKTNLENSPNKNEVSIHQISENDNDKNENNKLSDSFVLGNKKYTVPHVDNNKIFDSDDENCREKSEKEDKDDSSIVLKSLFYDDALVALETKEETTDFIIHYRLKK